MVRKRPCRVCGKWFLPKPRAGNRQKVCSDPACQRERHRRSCVQWHEKNPDYDKERRLAERVIRQDQQQYDDPLVKIAWDVLRDTVGVQLAVITEEIVRLVVSFVRDAVVSQALNNTAKYDKHIRSSARDAIERKGPSG